MNDINIIGTILVLVGIVIILLLFGYAIFIQWRLLGIIVYIAAICILLGSAFVMMDA